MNRFFRYDGEFSREIPSRAYARVDRVEDGRVLLEAIDADFIDEILPGNGEREVWGEICAKAPISILSIEAKTLRDRYVGPDEVAWRTSRNHRFPLGFAHEDRWFEFTISPSGDNAIWHGNLFDDGRSVAVKDVNSVAADLKRRFARFFALPGNHASPESLQTLIAGVQSHIEWVVVYDVGQGSAAALCDESGLPLLWFDTGGGVLEHKATFHPAMTGMCVVRDPPIVLSHWDWDHWSSALRFDALQDMHWIVPDQSLGAVHSAFAWLLSEKRRLHVWPPSLAQMTSGRIAIRKCTGGGRNHSGLAIEIHGPSGRPPVLLTGDARYSAIPGALDRDWHALVVPHHGADMRSDRVPRPAMEPASRVIYSCGAGNRWHHPCLKTRKRHSRMKWLHDKSRPFAGVDRQTDLLRTPAVPGHVGIGWFAGGMNVVPPCSCSACAMAFSAA